jgi:hypothetical protein
MSRQQYKVLIVIHDKWFSDANTYADYHAARRAQNTVARTNWKFETAIGKGSEVLNFRESDYFEATIENEGKH